jgi:hypothetical protein
MNLLELYKHILDSGGLIVDDKGCVSVNCEKFVMDKSVITKNTPVLVEGKRLVLPTREHLQNSDKDLVQVFHPICENIMRGESVVINKLRNVLVTRLNFTIAGVINSILDLGASAEKQNRLNPDQIEVLSVAPQIDETTPSVFTEIITKTLASDKLNSIVDIYLKKSGIINGAKFSKVGVVSFPLYEELCKEEDVVYGVKLRKKDKASFKAIFEYMFPNIQEKGSYNRGSVSQIAPFLDSLMQSFMGVAGRINDIVEIFNTNIDCYDKLLINAEWVDAFRDLYPFLLEGQKIPMQAGNEGSTPKKQEVAEPQQPAQQPQVTQPQLQYQTPTPVPQPQVYQQQPPVQQYQQPQTPQPQKDSDGKLIFQSPFARQPPQPQQPFYQPQYQMPQQQLYQPQYQQQQVLDPRMQAFYGNQQMEQVRSNQNQQWPNNQISRSVI